MASILVVEDSLFQAKHLEGILLGAGHKVELAGNGVAGLAAVRRALPDLVLTDMNMPEMNGLSLVHALRSEFPALPVLLTTDSGSEELAVSALRAGAASYLPKRNLARDVAELVDEILSVSASQRKQSLFLDRMTSVEYLFALENDTDLIPYAVGHTEALMRQMNLFDPSVHMRVGIAVHEAVVNAIVHGNLEIGSDLKEGNWQAYHDLVAARARQLPYSRRRVHIAIRATRSTVLEIRVRDEGPGFDPKKLPDPTASANLDKASGRGLLLIRTFFDTIEHSATGNEITMIKRTA
ncbi:response regulator [Fimbriiglobus ruber]|uniref:Response regulator of zinc sigma-54-dependent two-component system n=1 Tax=Fimbriiglobus ruber TaxID=1908690 RepID=A0A225CZQ3_9BACT|nr:response regulator [Fimbriiglobus ruber]OWK34732.1 Response regulator of zinc sigma-54-dependent two-component system [Fimbriiglobus ruber]